MAGTRDPQSRKAKQKGKAPSATQDDGIEESPPSSRRKTWGAKGGKIYPTPFTQEFPADAKLDGLVDAFERGDYRTVRDGAAKLAKETSDEEVRAAAKELLARIQPDPTSVLLIVIACVLLAVLAGYYWTHPHGA